MILSVLASYMCFLQVHCLDLGLCSEMYIDNVYVLCFNIKVRLEQFLSVTCTGYITYTMIGFMFIFEASITSYFTCTLTEIMFYVLTYHQCDSISSSRL